MLLCVLSRMCRSFLSRKLKLKKKKRPPTAVASELNSSFTFSENYNQTEDGAHTSKRASSNSRLSVQAGRALSDSLWDDGVSLHASRVISHLEDGRCEKFAENFGRAMCSLLKRPREIHRPSHPGGPHGGVQCAVHASLRSPLVSSRSSPIANIRSLPCPVGELHRLSLRLSWFSHCLWSRPSLPLHSILAFAYGDVTNTSINLMAGELWIEWLSNQRSPWGRGRVITTLLLLESCLVYGTCWAMGYLS